MNKVETNLRREADSVFLLVQVYAGTTLPNGKVVWAKTQHHDINLSYAREGTFNRFVVDGWLTPEDVAKIRADAAKLAGAA